MKIGFIGLGNVGGKLANSLLRNKFDLTVKDLDQNLTKPFYDLGAKVVNSTKELAEQQLVMKNALSIKRTEYNANPFTGKVNWKKNVTGIDSTKDMYPEPQGTRGN